MQNHKLIDFRYVVLLALLIVVFTSNMMLYPNNVALTPDRVWNYASENYFSHLTFNNGKIALWNTYEFSGTQLLVGSTGRFYPANLILFFTDNNLVTNIIIILHMFLAGFLMYVFARYMGQKHFGSLIAAMVFVFSIHFVMRLIGGTVHIIAYSLIPAIFLAAEYLIRKNSAKSAIFLGAVFGMQLLSGHPQYVFYAALSLPVYFFYRMFQEKSIKSSYKYAKTLLISAAVAFGISAIQLLPMFEFSNFISSRGSEATYAYVTMGSFSLKQLITIAMPKFFGVWLAGTYWGTPNAELIVYYGILPLLLVTAAMLSRNKNKFLFIAMMLFTFLFAMGRYGPLFPILYKLVPGINLFQAPARAMSIFGLFFSLLAGTGADTITNKLDEKKKSLTQLIKLWSPICLISAVVLAATLFLKSRIMVLGETLLKKYYYATYSNTYLVKSTSFASLTQKIPVAYDTIVSSLLVFIVLVLISLLFLWLFKNNKIRCGMLRLIIVIIIFADLFYFGNSIYLNSELAANKFFQGKHSFDEITNSEIANFISKDKSMFRVSDFANEILPLVGMRYGLYVTDGYNTYTINHYQKFLKTAKLGEPYVQSKLLGLLNVKYVVAKENLSGENYKFITKIDNSTVYENKEYLPRAFVVSRTEFSDDIINEMNKTSFNPAEMAFVEENVPETSNDFKPIEITSYEPNRISARVELEKQAFIVFSEIWYPGWKAYDNGIETKIYKTDHTLRGIHLPAGTHNIEMVFKPYSFYFGCIITIATVFILFIYFMRGFFY